MPPAVQVLCTNCESEPLRAIPAGEETFYRCASVAADDEGRSGCATLVTFMEHKRMLAKVTPAKKSTPTPAAVAPRNAIKPMGAAMRKPLSSLHPNSLHARTPLHGAKPAATTVLPTPTPAPAAAVHTPKATPTPAPAAPPKIAPMASSGGSTDSSDDEDDSEESEGDEEGGGEAAATTSAPAPPAKAGASGGAASKKPIGKKKATTSASAAKSTSSSSSSTFNLADPSVSAGDRMRALKAKLAAQRAQAAKEFAEKYGEEGDEETPEERAHAARKATGEAGEEFFASQGGEVERAPMMGALTIKGAENACGEGHRKPFTSPRLHGAMTAEAKNLIAERQKSMHIGRRLGARLRIFHGAFTGFKPLDSTMTEEGEAPPPPPPVVLTKAEELKAAPTGFEPLVIWQPTDEEKAANANLATIEVPMVVAKWLRPHQREGVKFMCECVLGQRNLGPADQTETVAPQTKTITQPDGTTTTVTLPPSLASLGGGSILADDMGLGKTLQSVALLYTLLTQGFEKDQPVARKVLIVTPTSLVSNWANEIEKWLGKGKVNVVALSEVGKDNIDCGIDSFVGRFSKAHVLIISYDTFRRKVDKLNKPGLCDLLICDEAHRLKNNKTSTYTALDSLPCKRRVLLSGTPMQNDLSEFFSMINFTNRNILGDRKCFKRYYELPILLGREPEALQSDADRGSERASELSAIVNQFVLRRTNVLLRQHLPPKVIQVVCCRPSTLQVKLYQSFLKSKSVRKLTNGDEGGGGHRGGGGLQALPLITSLKKLCNHPKLIYDTALLASTGRTLLKNEEGEKEKVPPALLAIFKDILPTFKQDAGFLRNPSDACHSGKMFVLERLLTQVRMSGSGERIVIVSNFTSALDVIATMCQTKRWDYLRLDGSTSIKKRQVLVDQLSDHRGNKVFVFLLSSRAGGCGLNLIGANRLILFDPDWNPAVDKQAAARVWRDGQTKRCFVYRFLTTGSIEEKVYQRQLSKEGLSGVLGGSTADASLTKDELRDLFTLDDRALEQPSDTHKSLDCDCLDAFQITTEEEALKAEEAGKKEAEEHGRHVEEAARKAKEAAAAMEGEEGGGAAGAAAAATAADTAMTDEPATFAMNDDGDAKMEDIEPGAQSAEGKEGEPNDDAGGAGGGEGDGNDSSSSSDDEEMNDFIEKDSGDDGDSDGGDYGAKKKGGKASSKAKKPSKKDGPRKQRKKRAAIGSLNFPQLHALPSATLGQRGEPPEEELVNWAHHATSNSIPDPIFRVAAKTMPFTRGQLPFVSFVFSCEVSGKAILNSTDASDASKVTSRCEAAPTTVQASKPKEVSLEIARANHAEFMERERVKQRKRAGNDDVSVAERLADPSKRRHSSRNAGKPSAKEMAEDEEDDDDRAFIAKDGDEDDDDNNDDGPDAGADGPEGEGQERGKEASRKRKAKAPPAAAAEMDEASRRLIEHMMQEDSGIIKRRKTTKHAAASPKSKKKKKNQIEEEEEDDEEMAPVAQQEPKGPAPMEDIPESGEAEIDSRSATPQPEPERPPPAARPTEKKSPAKSPTKKSPAKKKQPAALQEADATDSDVEIVGHKKVDPPPSKAKQKSPIQQPPPSPAKHQPAKSKITAPPAPPPQPMQEEEEEEDEDFLED